MQWNIVLMVIGILALIESVFALSFPKITMKICKKLGFKKLCKNEKIIKKIATWELVIAIILLVIGYNI